MGIDVTDRQIFGHALDEPQRQLLECRAARVIGLAPGDVVLERMHELVTEDVVGFREDPASGITIRRLKPSVTPPVPSPSSPERRSSAGSPGSTRTGERLTAPEVVVENLAAAYTTARPYASLFGGGALFRIEVDAEMLGLEDLEFELLFGLCCGRSIPGRWRVTPPSGRGKPSPLLWRFADRRTCAL